MVYKLGLMDYGVPLGSKLGPLLFLPMLNCSIKASFRIFPDDTVIFYSNKDTIQLQTTMQQEFQNLMKQYCQANKYSVDPKKHFL